MVENIIKTKLKKIKIKIISLVTPAYCLIEQQPGLFACPSRFLLRSSLKQRFNAVLMHQHRRHHRHRHNRYHRVEIRTGKVRKRKQKVKWKKKTGKKGVEHQHHLSATSTR